MDINKTVACLKTKCYGCSACELVCPQHSISMHSDAEGFLYPRINEHTCIECGRCLKICPRKGIAIEKQKIKICGAIHLDEKIWKKSSSGGAFDAICRLYGDDNTIIFGAKYNRLQHRVEHVFIRGINEIDAFRGSKYVQSYLGNSFKQVSNFLTNGERVIFTGTPCQIAGLKRYLKGINTNTDELLCVDVVCNGVGSPTVFGAYLSDLEKKFSSQILDYKFRDKKILLGVHKLYRRTVSFANGKVDSDSNDLYNCCYVKKLFCRPSCFDCQFSLYNLESDLTIGDFKRMYQVVSKAPINRNGSVVISHTFKGQKVFDALPNVMMTYNILVDDFYYPSGASGNKNKRNDFFEEYIKKTNDIRSLMKKYEPKKGILQRVWCHIPDRIRATIKRIGKGVKG